MDVQNMLSHEVAPRRRSDFMNNDTHQEATRAHAYPTRQSTQSVDSFQEAQMNGNVQASPVYPLHSSFVADGYGQSPIKGAMGKNITFELLFDGDTRSKARLPMKVAIYSHDNTDGIVSTVKNFFGLYDKRIEGVSFEDACGNTLIASYDNFEDGMTVFVKVNAESPQVWETHQDMMAPHDGLIKHERVPHLDEGFAMLPHATHASYGINPPSRPPSRITRLQSTSPQLNGTSRTGSVQKGRPRQPGKRESLDGSFQSQLEKLNSENFKEYNSSDGDAASVTSSFRAKNEHLASAEISEANIVEGGRRQKAKFESSELPLFVPPQVPAPQSTSSISPQRRSIGHEVASPFAGPNHHYFNRPMPSPRNGPYTNVYQAIAAKVPAPAHGHRLRDRVGTPTSAMHIRGGMGHRGSGPGILPTPDPTIASTISDEDVALQLMRLGDPANMSHGRTSTSTVDDAFSGRAELASSATSDGDIDSLEDRPRSSLRGEEHMHNAPMSRKRPADGAVSDLSGEDEYHNDGSHTKRPKLTASNSTGHGRVGPVKRLSKSAKPRNPLQSKKPKFPTTTTAPKVPISPASLPPQSRKGSTSSLMGPPQLPFTDDQDLSSKPRCQRCRKSKKGCDRQRPCQRCKDAGLGADDCVSEDENNGRKGRFGRHMGVPVSAEKLLAGPTTEDGFSTGPETDLLAGADKNKKRKK